MAWFHCNSDFYIGFKHFYVSLMDCFWENQYFLVNTLLGQVSVIANNMFFSEKLAVIHCKNGLGFIANQCFKMV